MIDGPPLVLVGAVPASCAAFHPIRPHPVGPAAPAGANAHRPRGAGAGRRHSRPAVEDQAPVSLHAASTRRERRFVRKFYNR
jgi:hypothetical protein